MAIETLEKKCKKCGGNEWYINSRKFCVSCQKKSCNKNGYHNSKNGKIAINKARKKERDNLSDNYIRQSIYISIYNTYNIKIIRKEISPEMIITQRRKLKLNRTIKHGNRNNRTYDMSSLWGK